MKSDPQVMYLFKGPEPNTNIIITVTWLIGGKQS